MRRRLLATTLGLSIAALGVAIAAPSASAQTLARGSAGPAVAEWQDELNDWLQVNRPEQGRLAVDGIFGPRTEAATRDFQSASGITVDGIVGPRTRAALASAGDDRSTATRPILEEGDRGPAVARWQERLNDWLAVNRPEMGRLTVDGIYGPMTEAATIDFQRAQQLVVDGVVGPNTRGAFRDTPVAEEDVPEPGPILLRGSTGDAVSAWQRQLNDAGADIAVDGIYGPNTEEATRAFQREGGILVDGIVGPQTRAAMEDEAA